MELRNCFRVDIPTRKGEEFTYWLLKSNNPKIGPYPYHVVPAGSLRVDKEKIKIFLRDYKLQKLLK